MKKYLHKPTGRVFEKSGVWYGDTHIDAQVRDTIVENPQSKDWQEVFPPTRTPVVTLGGVNLYDGDLYWYVNTAEWRIIELKAIKDQKLWPGGECFPSLSSAKEYVRMNKPVIPLGELENCARMGHVEMLLEKYKSQ